MQDCLWCSATTFFIIFKACSKKREKKHISGAFLNVMFWNCLQNVYSYSYMLLPTLIQEASYCSAYLSMQELITYNGCWALVTVSAVHTWVIYIRIPALKVQGTSQRKRWKNRRAGGWRGDLWKAVLLICHGWWTYGITETVVTYTWTTQDQASKNYRMEVEGLQNYTYSWKGIGRWWILQEGITIFLQGMAKYRWFIMQCVTPHLCTTEQHWLDLVGNE